MLQTLKLLLPALIPSWRFFETVAPSPRIEFVVLNLGQHNPAPWQEFRPRPTRLSFGSMLKRLFWNPRWNETLFLVSCAERLMANPSKHSELEIITRIQAEHGSTTCLQFRLVFVSRKGEELQKYIAFVSPIYGTSP